MELIDYITDGSLARACDTLAELTGIRPFLRNSDGSVIHTDEQGLARPDDADNGEDLHLRACYVAPVKLELNDSEVEIGAICLPEPPDDIDENNLKLAEKMITLLASLTSENCSKQQELSARLTDLNSLFRLTARVAATHNVDEILEAMLDAALEVTGASAVAARLLDRASGELRLRAHRGLSSRFCQTNIILLRESPHDQQALDEELCYVSDVMTDSGFAGSDCCSAEGLTDCLIAGLVYQGRRIGTLRAYHHDKQPFTSRQRELLQTIAQLAAAAIGHAGLLLEERRSREIQRQVKLASAVQQRMLPNNPPTYDNLDVAAKYIPCRELGGDFYDLFDLAGNLGFVIGDVVGKGVAASLLMASVRSALRAFAQTIYDIRRIITLTNESLARDTEPNEFATLFYGVLDPETLRLSYVNAGHDYPIIVRTDPEGGEPFCFSDVGKEGGLPIGIDVAEEYSLGIVDLQPGDVMLCFTDGLAEAVNFESEEYGKERIRRSILDLLRKEPKAPAEQVLSHVLWEMRRFAGLQQRPDDVTLLCIRVREA